MDIQQNKKGRCNENKCENKLFDQKYGAYGLRCFQKCIFEDVSPLE